MVEQLTKERAVNPGVQLPNIGLTLKSQLNENCAVPKIPDVSSAALPRDIRNVEPLARGGSRGRHAKPISDQRTEPGFAWLPLNPQAEMKRGCFREALI